MDSYDVLILGAGYAGLMCATRLFGRRRGGGLRLGLVNRAGEFVERLRGHEGLAEPGFRVAPRLPPLQRFLAGSGVDLIEGTVAAIERSERRVLVETPAGGRWLGYSRLVVALGSEVETRHVPGVATHAYVLNPCGPHGEPELRRRLQELPIGRRRILVVGGGATGIEAASELARLDGAKVSIVTAGAFADFATEPVRRQLRRAVARAGVETIEHTRASSVEADRLVTSRAAVACDLVVWCAGFRCPAVVEASGFEVDREGRIRADPYLRSLNDPAVYAAGDACRPVEWHGAPPRMSAFFALATGAHVADTIAALHAGRAARPFGFWTFGQAIAVGEEAVGFATIPYDRQVGPIYRRRTAFFLRGFFVWMLVRLIILVRRFPRLPFWLGRRAWRSKAVRAYPAPRPVKTEHSAA